jgi:hypothetical protein
MRMRVFFLLLSVLLFVFSVLNFMNIFKFEQNIWIASLSLILGVVFLGVQDYCFYKQVKKQKEEAKLHQH